jgi:hypothetical protein
VSKIILVHQFQDWYLYLGVEYSLHCILILLTHSIVENTNQEYNYYTSAYKYSFWIKEFSDRGRFQLHVKTEKDY